MHEQSPSNVSIKESLTGHRPSKRNANLLYGAQFCENYADSVAQRNQARLFPSGGRKLELQSRIQLVWVGELIKEEARQAITSKVEKFLGWDVANSPHPLILTLALVHLTILAPRCGPHSFSSSSSSSPRY